jgi:hypothetical protein
MSLILSWVLFPLMLAAVGLGWGVLVERAAGVRVGDALLLPMGLAAALVVAGTLTAFDITAPAAVPVAGAGAAAGLLLAWPRLPFRGVRSPGRRPLLGRWPLLAGVGVLLVYGAPVLLSGQATFTGYVKLDDTSTWFNIVDIVMAHGRSAASLPSSTFSLTFSGDVGRAYPVGAFMLLGVGHGLTGIDVAWIIQPYLAFCGAAVALCVYALVEPVIPSPKLRALVAFLAAQPALLYGYSLWGGIKEMTAAFLLVLGMALATQLLRRDHNLPGQRPTGVRRLLPLALAAGALTQTLGVGAAGWVVPAMALVAAVWLTQGWRAKALWASLVSLMALGSLTVIFVVPVLTVLQSFVGKDAGLFSSAQTQATRFGNLLGPLSGWQLAGIWPAGDFRFSPPTVPTVLLVGFVVIAAVIGLWTASRRRHFGLTLYVAVALLGCGVVYFSGGTPWVTGKALAISSPALLAAALAGAGMLWSAKQLWRTGTGALLMAILAFGVLWSNVDAYQNVTLAPRDRLAELQHIGELVAGRGPTFVNMYDVYADRHFLREGAPTEPAEYRPANLPLREGAILTKAAWADLDSFPLSTIEPYRSIVTQRTPADSRPPSIYKLMYQGRYYQLWQRPEHPATRIVEHIPYGESIPRPYCGAAQNAVAKPLCSMDPVAIASCPQIRSLARKALEDHARLVAYQRPIPTVAFGDEVLWPGSWTHDPVSHSLTPTTPGTAVGHMVLRSSQRYELFLSGSFARGFDVGVDGREVGTVKNQLALFGGYDPVADIYLSAGVHRFTFTYPRVNLTPGSNWNQDTTLSGILLEPLQSPTSELITVGPAQATRLCGRPLDWIELVTGS